MHARPDRLRHREILIAVVSLALGAVLSPMLADAAHHRRHCSSHHHHRHRHRHTGPTLFASGFQPADATVFTESGPSTGNAFATIDGDAKTAWTRHSLRHGIMVDPNPGTTRGIGVVSATKGWDLQVWFSDDDHPSSFDHGKGDGWAFVGETNTSGKDRFDVAGIARHAKHFLVWPERANGVDPIRVNEIQLFQ